jgi:hypothetical protein
LRVQIAPITLSLSKGIIIIARDRAPAVGLAGAAILQPNRRRIVDQYLVFRIID